MHRTRNIYISLLLPLLSACGGKKQAPAGPMPKPTVSVYEVKPATFKVTEKFPATLTGNVIVDLKSDVTGFLEAIRVKDGSTVKKGQVLYEVDKSRSQATYEQSEASVRQAEADLALKKKDYERYSNLLQQDAISRQTVDQAETALRTAEANLAAAKAARARSGTDINHAVLRAPLNGKIGIATIRIGDLVTAGQTVINTLVNEDPIYADIDLPQSRYTDFNRGGQQFYLIFGNGEHYSHEGKILLVNNVVDPRTGTIRMRLTFPNPQGTLKSGMTGAVEIHSPAGSSQVAIPSRAIVELLGEVKAYVVDRNNVIQMRPVERGAVVDSMMIVRSGLQAGDRVVVDGIQKVHQGDTVNIK
ncbi:efflux RND transporter periplasmic adaptor subunit [Chitinophaga alhagiae]|uniref:Efflux RND transporter periplasmic adaptor subunit n=1 Tax=Chitinophaga alhagiae TaxID=2203219 RepID=A0ABM6WA01_9BACT|nr:efflux RND transporter periplasmic adaptor subunit [Chitinophaga alhagiae]AWO00793.1 efflux RND transporter periplasmic adaptor subunit [Chitinophaga alhagiae]